MGFVCQQVLAKSRTTLDFSPRKSHSALRRTFKSFSLNRIQFFCPLFENCNVFKFPWLLSNKLISEKEKCKSATFLNSLLSRLKCVKTYGIIFTSFSKSKIFLMFFSLNNRVNFASLIFYIAIKNTNLNYILRRFSRFS